MIFSKKLDTTFDQTKIIDNIIQFKIDGIVLFPQKRESVDFKIKFSMSITAGQSEKGRSAHTFPTRELDYVSIWS